MDQGNLKHTTVLNNIWNELEKAAKDREHEYHNAYFSSLNINGNVSSRTVILRNLSKKENYVSFHADHRSTKIHEIKKNNNCFILFYSFKMKEQIRLEVQSTVHNKNSISKKAWNKTKLMSRKCYLSKSAPGSLSNIATDGIPNHLKGIEPKISESEKGYQNFSVIYNYIKSIDWLYLSSQGHKRILFEFKNNRWNSNWKIP